MKKLLLSAVTILAFGSVASAADLPTKGPAPVVARPTCAAQWWQGGYIGINGGGTHWTANRTDQDEVLVDTATYVQKEWGGTVGGQAGYNFARCNTLWGIEVDGNWMSNDVTTRLLPNAQFFDIRVQSKFDAIVTARVRGGVVVDDLFIYVTGGLAGGHFKTTYSSAFNIPGVINVSNSAEFSDWRLGWVAGFGTEWRWTDHWTVKGEVLYAEFADRTKTVLFAPPNGNASFTESDSIWISRIALNYKF